MKNFIVVAGVNYMNFKSNIFFDRAMKRKDFLLERNKDDDVNITLFDFRSGVLEMYFRKKNAPRPTTIPIFKFAPVTQASYVMDKKRSTSPSFKDFQPKVMSITNLYHTIENLGASDMKGTLMELSIFSHAFIGGPILVNSFDDEHQTLANGERVKLTNNNRDPDDKDGRAIKDFENRFVKVDKFHNAFHKDGFAWLWGCAFTHYMVNLFTALFAKGSPYKPKGVKDSDEFTLKLETAVAELLREWYDLEGKNDSIQLSFGRLREVIFNETMRTYCNHLAKRAKIKVWGALPGLGSTYEARFMKIAETDTTESGGTMQNGRNAKILEFYKNYLDINFDSDGTHYALYRPEVILLPKNPS